MNETYISNQIAVYKTDKGLLEFSDKLKRASIAHYANIHAGEKDEAGKHVSSLIGILMKDYSKGTGDKAVTVSANVDPDEIRYIFSRLSAGFQTFEFSQDKIFGTPDEKGYSLVTKLRISRIPKDRNGNVRNYPWYIEVENGRGISVKNAAGGSYMKSGSFVSTRKVYVNLSDLDLYKKLSRVVAYISAWELTIGPPLITAAKKKLEQMQNAKQSA